MNHVTSLIYRQVMSPDSMTSQVIEVSRPRPPIKQSYAHSENGRKVGEMNQRYKPKSSTFSSTTLPSCALQKRQKQPQKKTPTSAKESKTTTHKRAIRATSIPRCQTDLRPKRSLSSYSRMQKTTPPGSPTKSAGSNNRAATGPLQEGHNQIWTLFEQPLSKTGLRR